MKLGNACLSTTSAGNNKGHETDLAELERFLIGDVQDRNECNSYGDKNPTKQNEPTSDATSNGMNVCTDSNCEPQVEMGSPIPVRITTRTNTLKTDVYMDFPLPNERVRKRSKRL